MMENKFKELSLKLVENLNPDGFWTGELSSSALGVAVAATALYFYDNDRYTKEISSGIEWLFGNINPDGGYGDTPDSPGNISTTLLVYACLSRCASENVVKEELLSRISVFLNASGIDVNSDSFFDNVLNYYQKDYTFSVPILTMCAVCSVPDDKSFRRIPQLPFELALLPRKFYNILNLNVVSYAIPALIAVGILLYKKKNAGLFMRWIRNRSIGRAMELLRKMTPDSGGFLEAIPLTAFVCLSLINSGYHDDIVVRKGIGFLLKTQRQDGSWPIDIDLSTWVTTLSIKSLRSYLPEVLTKEMREKIVAHLKHIQSKDIHLFNGTGPGGWGWTNYSGSVPDADDTPGSIISLLLLESKDNVKNEVLDGVKWLCDLQNNDGGFPSFSKGWGKLPFDRSTSDITGHCLLALSYAIENYKEDLPHKDLMKILKTFNGALNFLDKKQYPEGYWLPLWFGNQFTEGHINPVYGTARVISYLRDLQNHVWLTDKYKFRIKKMIEKGSFFLLKTQNQDGSWGGDRSITGSMEETSLAISALISDDNKDVCKKGFQWLEEYYNVRKLQPSPIGLYFASLWYSEKMYPLTAYTEALAREAELT